MKKDTTYFKRELEKEYTTLVDELKSIGRINPQHSGDWEATSNNLAVDAADEGEVANVIDSLEENTAILSKLEPRLNEVKAALERIRSGAFGICTVCNKPIEEERLVANPAATTCVAHMK